MLNEGGMDLGMQDTLRALADPTRREILNLLKHSRLSAGEICNHFSISDAAVSRHLSVLKDADLIRDEREENLSIMSSMHLCLRRLFYGLVN